MNCPAATQAAREQLLTTAHSFHNFEYRPENKYLLQVLPGNPAIEALNSSSCLLASVTSFLDRLIDGDTDANEIYAVRFMVEATKALIDSTTKSVEFGNLHGGAQ
ncbi:DUF3077 domain-containing protein [Pseudomonas sp. ADAK18]|uniref:DUF3077 domain-containing protein n=1 Tax=Pseudomonas sp. ADAK18 TaxID=2730848 RepID=UPI001462C11D|nr:DUF3077 domain-containing protein [Pseudomonas sp. ADAK18]QJI30091.1 DUF3077 domain-containing protein [Pseudomonas sp. ADAK18]